MPLICLIHLFNILFLIRMVLDKHHSEHRKYISSYPRESSFYYAADIGNNERRSITPFPFLSRYRPCVEVAVEERRMRQNKQTKKHLKHLKQPRNESFIEPPALVFALERFLPQELLFLAINLVLSCQ